MTEILRENVEEKFKWDLSPLCGDDEDFYSKVERAKKYLPELKKYEGKLNNKNKGRKKIRQKKGRGSCGKAWNITTTAIIIWTALKSAILNMIL